MSKFLSDMKTGVSLSLVKELTDENLELVKKAGIDFVEFSYSIDYYFNTLEFPANGAKYGQMVRDHGLEVWSLHLPFSRTYDISSENEENRRDAIERNKLMIRAAADAGAKLCVLHPSSEPIEDERRPERLRRSRDAILELKEVADECKILIAVENLPRTCLTRTSDEMIWLLKETGAKMCFDTNHSLVEDDLAYVRNVTDAGVEIITLHMSDYDMIDERHRLPGDGVVEWQKLFALLEKVNYSGIMMYEVAYKPKDREEIITPEMVARNADQIKNGKI